MPNLLPTLFIVLASIALVLTLLWLWQSLRLALVHTLVAPREAVVSQERGALLAEKQALLVALKDLEAERESGKLSADDFTQLNAQYRARALQVLRELDTLLSPYRSDAKSLLDAVASGAPLPPEPAADGGEASVAAIGVCPSCQAVNDRDAVFCKKCGTRLQKDEALA
jgi:ribosomal protein L40E